MGGCGNSSCSCASCGCAPGSCTCGVSTPSGNTYQFPTTRHLPPSYHRSTWLFFWFTTKLMITAEISHFTFTITSPAWRIIISCHITLRPCWHDVIKCLPIRLPSRVWHNMVKANKTPKTKQKQQKHIYWSNLVEAQQTRSTFWNENQATAQEDTVKKNACHQEQIHI